MLALLDDLVDTGVAPPVILVVRVVMLPVELPADVEEPKAPGLVLEVVKAEPAPEVNVYAELAS